MSLSPLTSLPLEYIVNIKIVNNGVIFTLPTYSHYREMGVSDPVYKKLGVGEMLIR